MHDSQLSQQDLWAVNSPGFDLVMHRSWPALEVLEHQGWLLRSARGVTKRANSVLPLKADSTQRQDGAAGVGAGLLSAVQFAEAHYRSLDLPCIFQRRLRTEPAGLTELLRQRGYTDQAATEVMTRPMPADLAERDDFEIEYTVSPSAEWLDFMQPGGEQAQHRRTTLAELFGAGTAIYGSVRRQGQIAAIGRLSIDPQSGWAGLAALATDPAQRGQGMGSELISGLLARGRERGANRVFLQVERSNPAARRLYTRLGFEHSGDYFYSIAE
ncbi:GNAT family N-acetyltransferase [Psychromicrobium lacuslunae]|uniref:N-acetyltransferase domain-containing protein n=1 Tax=Psychromicrobium lacuslunae TaxID=1618207 RepID=A0A0D4BXB8_9MICC|nr:GNAT family N-acetyltransferase [Psychromicrobium lacuslunae]AJT40969.1 hypothetical protein UM93_04595 [Psychromicrobium lacuslunae]